MHVSTLCCQENTIVAVHGRDTFLHRKELPSGGLRADVYFTGHGTIAVSALTGMMRTVVRDYSTGLQMPTRYVFAGCLQAITRDGLRLEARIPPP